VVKSAPILPASADSFAARLAACPTPVSKMAELIKLIDDLQEAAEVVERASGKPFTLSSMLIGASVFANEMLCTIPPTDIADCRIIARTAIGPAEFAADCQDESPPGSACRAVVAALKGLDAHLGAAA